MSGSRQDLEAAQLDHLVALFRTLDGSAFHTARLDGTGLSPTRPPASIAEFCAKVPLTTKQDLLNDQQAHPPYGSLLTRPINEYVRLHQTSSTTGAPLRWPDTRKSWECMLEDWVTVLEAAGVTSRDRMLAAFSFGPFIGFWLGFEAAARIGCMVIPGGALNSVTRLRAILANDVTVVCCTPTYAIRLGETAREEGIDLGASSVRHIIVAGEPGGSLRAIRDRIESLWPGARAFDHHGMTEIGPATFECPESPGWLHLIESSLLCEFIDPASQEPASEGSDVPSELVVTTLRRTGSPVLRYRTGDLVIPERLTPCPCGRVERGLRGGIIGRTDDMVFVRGVNLYPGAVEQIIRRRSDIAEYRVEIREERGMHELRLLIEPDASVHETEPLCRDLEDSFRGALNLRVPIEVVASGSLPRFEFKAKRWVRVGSFDADSRRGASGGSGSA